MQLFNIINSFLLLLLFGLAVGFPTNPSAVDIKPAASTTATTATTLDKRINLCSPLCKKEADDLQSCRWIPYCVQSHEHNIQMQRYDDCCRVANWTQPLKPGNKPNEIVEKLHRILQNLSLMKAPEEKSAAK